MKDTPINAGIVSQKLKESNLKSIGKASIREIKRLVDTIEQSTGDRFIRMEMGIPGLPPVAIGTKAEIEALKKGVAAIYPDIHGIPQLKKEISRFVKLFIDIDVNPAGCLPTVGSMQGSFASFMTVNKMYLNKDTILFIDPGFPVHKLQLQVQGVPWESFDVYNFRGDKLREKLESFLTKGNISTILYSNPNNPSWICFTDRELKIIGELAEKYNVVIIEDLAYIAMDFRKDMSQPGKPPYQPTVAKYTGNYILLSIVIFIVEQSSYLAIIFMKFFKTILQIIKLVPAHQIPHSAQYALAAILKAVNKGEYNFVDVVREYGEKARIMKKLFTDNGFQIVYDRDEENPIADGFYFTFSYPGFTGEELLEKLIYYGISAISLDITGSERTEGIRACVSLVGRDQFDDLEYRLKKFHEYYG